MRASTCHYLCMKYFISFSLKVWVLDRRQAENRKIRQPLKTQSWCTWVMVPSDLFQGSPLSCVASKKASPCLQKITRGVGTSSSGLGLGCHIVGWGLDAILCLEKAETFICLFEERC